MGDVADSPSLPESPRGSGPGGVAQEHVLQALHDLAVACAGVLDPIAISRLAADKARDLTRTDSATLYWSDADASMLRSLGDNDPTSASAAQMPPPGRGLVRTAFTRREPIALEDYPSWEHAAPTVVARGVRSAAAVPLVVRDRAVGVLVVRSRASRGWSPHDLQLLRLLAAQVAPALEAARLHADLQRKQAETAALAELARQGAAEHDPDRAIILVCEHARSLVDSDYAGVVLIEGDGTRVWRGMSGNRAQISPIVTRGRGVGATARALAAGRTILLERLHEQTDASQTHTREGGHTALAVPLTGRGGLAGALHLGWRTDVVPTPAQVHLAEALATYAVTVLENAGAHAALAHQALYDSLTGLPNRRLFYDRLSQSILASRRDAYPIALMLMDLDRFKEVNDNLGHQAGDRVLQEVARRLRAALRGSDTVCRLGGDEFAMVLWNIKGAPGAGVAANKAIEALRPPMLLDGQPVHVSGSIGVALCPEHGDDGEILLRRADVAMYAAKRTRGGYSVLTPELDRDLPGSPESTTG